MITKLKELITGRMLIPPRILLLILILANIGIFVVAKKQIGKHHLEPGVVYISAESVGLYESLYECNFIETADVLITDLECYRGNKLLVWNKERSYFNPLGSLQNYFIFWLFFITIVVVYLGVILFQYFIERDDSYLYYAGCLFLVAINSLCRVEFGIEETLVYHKLPTHYLLLVFCEVSMYVSYKLFLYDFLRDKDKTNVKLTTLYNLITTIPLIIALSIIFSEQINGPSEIENGFITGGYLFFHVVGLYFVYLLFQSSKSEFKRASAKLILIGVSCLFVSAIVGIPIIQLSEGNDALASILFSEEYLAGAQWITRLQVVAYSAPTKIIEFFLMMIGLSIKVRLDKEEQRRLENNSRTYQLGHHVVFDFLTRVKLNIQKESKTKAISYLVDFSKYLRFILDNTLKKKVKIYDELQFSKRYLEMERKGSIIPFTYEITGDKELMYDLDIPPFSLQPLLENSIKYGFSKEGDSYKNYHISISVFKKGNQTICRLEDNGVGRQASSVIQRKENINGIGLSNTQTRLAAANIRMEIYDLVDAEGKAQGTAVELVFPE